MRDIPFVEKEYYHIYNRGVDGRKILLEHKDLERFIKSMREFNTIKPIGSIYENRERKRGSRASTTEGKPLVKFTVYGINPNHFHFMLEQVSEKGIEKFMHRLGTGFSKYFNAKYKRSGSLFQGKFKAKLIDTNEYLPEPICAKERILEQFKNRAEYKKFAEESLRGIIERKILLEELEETGI